MDVLELPRPVINFLRTMAKESCRYVLSWDIFGGTDTVTLTLTWKSIDHETHVTIKKIPHIQLNDDREIQNTSLRRSRRDEQVFTPAVCRPTRGKSLEGTTLIPNKQNISLEKQGLSLERLSCISQQQSESDPIYSQICNVKCADTPSPSSIFDKIPPVPIVNTSSRRTKLQYEPSILRRVIPSIPIVSSAFSKLRRPNQLSTYNNNQPPDPWVKRFECPVKENTTETVQPLKSIIQETGAPPGKVKFKKKPDYF